MRLFKGSYSGDANVFEAKVFFSKECSLLKGVRIFCLPLGLCNFQS